MKFKHQENFVQFIQVKIEQINKQDKMSISIPEKINKSNNNFNKLKNNLNNHRNNYMTFNNNYLKKINKCNKFNKNPKN